MAPIKFEDSMREQLEQRRLEPKKEAWNRLEQRLDAQPHTRKMGMYWWIGIAAGLVGLLLAVSFMWKSDPDGTVESVIVDTDTQSPETDPDRLEVERINPISPLNSGDALTTIALEETPNEDAVESEPFVKSSQEDQPEAQAGEMLAENKDIAGETEQSLPELEEELSFEDQKVLEVLAKIEGLQKENKAVTEAEIDALLAQAEQELALQRERVASSGNVDPDALLADVEADLERSFRDRIFKALKAGYKDVKTVVARRND